jgi:hypothetical protein
MAVDTQSKIEQSRGGTGQKRERDLLKNLSSGNQEPPKFLIASGNLSDYTH